MRLSDLLIVFKNPRVAAIAGVVLGLILGLIVGWGVWPVKWTDAPPSALSQRYQEDYLRMAIDSYHSTKDEGLALQRWGELGDQASKLMNAVSDNPGGQRPGWIQEYRNFIESQVGPIPSSQAVLPTESSSTPPIEPTTTPPSTRNLLLIAVGSLLALGVIGGAVYYFFLRPLLFGRTPPTGEISPARQAQEIAKATEKTDFQDLGLAKPITQTMTTYVLGDDLYDESFSIDAQSGDFLGEYGVGVSETMVSGEPKKVTAIEIWLFDKNDIKTATKVFMSAYAHADPAIRGRLEAKGELVLIEKEKQTMLETQTLQLLATVVDLEYGHGNLPDQSYFERVTLELAIWPKKKQA